MTSKTQFYSNFAVAYHSAFRPHFRRGGTLGKKRDAWRNVAEHCLVAGVLAKHLAKLMGLSAVQIKNVTYAAILHDWNKKHETLMRKQSVSMASLRSLLMQMRDADQQILLQMGYSQAIVRLAGANVPADQDGPQTDEEKIVWYVDAMLTDTQPSRISDRFDELERHPLRGKSNIEFSNSFVEVYGISLYDLQRRIATKVESYIASRIGFTGIPEELPFALEEIVKAKISNHAN